MVRARRKAWRLRLGLEKMGQLAVASCAGYTQ